jgi:TonB family protein
MSTMAAWFLYSMVVANLLGLAAVAGEGALRGSGRAGRWVWVAALGLSIALPLLAWLGLSMGSVPSVPEGAMLHLPPITITTSATTASAWSLDDVLLGLWVGGAAAVVAFIGLTWLAMRGEQRHWRRCNVDGVDVMVTADRGPAVYGVRRARILVPEWALELEDRVRRLMLLHEGEHARAGDTRVVLFGLMVVAIAPWNVLLWWHFRRLRQAIELDCDARVLRRAPDARRYGSLLLEVGRRRSAPVLGLALAEPVSFLERRIRLITAKASRGSIQRVAALGGLALLLAAAALFTRDPVMETDGTLALEAGFDPVAFPIALAQRDTPPAGGPRFTPFTVAPRLLNSGDVEAALDEAYPQLLRKAGIGGQVNVWFFIDESGVVQKVLVNEGSGYPALDEAALKVADIMRFSPALNRDRRTAVWVSLPIRFLPSGVLREQEERAVGEQAARMRRIRDALMGELVRREEALVDTRRRETDRRSDVRADESAGSVENAARRRPGPVVVESPSIAVAGRPTPSLATGVVASMPERRRIQRDISESPSFTPFTVAPRLMNATDVSRILEREYPTLLRTAGVGGSVTVWFFIDPAGRVEKTLVGRSSGYASLDEAALRVADDMEFSPALNRDQPVSVWVALPIKFSTR